jgi:hypothetical protein
MGLDFCRGVFSRFDPTGDGERVHAPTIGQAPLMPDNVQRSIEMVLRFVVGKMCHVWTAPLRQVLTSVMTIAVGCSHVSGLLMQPFPRLLALM